MKQHSNNVFGANSNQSMKERINEKIKPDFNDYFFDHSTFRICAQIRTKGSSVNFTGK